ncbi:MAG: SDR family NAD(P)-dependent oxidoreductase [Porticoccaceae bacterium]|nr:SDR family NAD(P)-dependent oxidoreductase [Porticoccaceae bacterium]
MKVLGQIALITGGASGLGAGAARILTKAGVTCALLDRNLSLAEELVKELGGGMAIECDVSDGPGVEAAIAEVTKTLGAPRIVLNAAGIDIAVRTASPKGPHSLEEFQRVINVNLTGTFNVARVAAYGMIGLDVLSDNGNEDGERGVVINIASVVAQDGPVGQAAYAASKAGVQGMTLPMARDLAPYGIRVMTIAPGMFETPLAAGIPQKWIDSIIPTVPFPKRWGNPLEFGALVQHICENSMLNGEMIRIDGAIRMGL